MIAKIVSLRQESDEAIQVLVSYRDDNVEVGRREFRMPADSNEAEVRRQILAAGATLLKVNRLDTTLRSLIDQTINIPDIP